MDHWHIRVEGSGSSNSNLLIPDPHQPDTTYQQIWSRYLQATIRDIQAATASIGPLNTILLDVSANIAAFWQPGYSVAGAHEYEAVSDFASFADGLISDLVNRRMPPIDLVTLAAAGIATNRRVQTGLAVAPEWVGRVSDQLADMDD